MKAKSVSTTPADPAAELVSRATELCSELNALREQLPNLERASIQARQLEGGFANQLRALSSERMHVRGAGPLDDLDNREAAVRAKHSTAMQESSMQSAAYDQAKGRIADLSRQLEIVRYKIAKIRTASGQQLAGVSA
jgi:hypothetical protein